MRLRPLRPWGLSLGTFNKQYDGGFGNAHVIWAVYIGDFDQMILAEIKITGQAYLRNRLGYGVVCLPSTMMAYGGVQGGVGLVIRDQTQGWSIELTRFTGRTW